MNNRMVRMVVIDDIKSVVDGISCHISWKNYGVEVVGTALNGKKGLELIQFTNPDIILTDIRMPKMNGLEMTKRVLEDNPNCQIIILSGYTDFVYTKEAIRLGALDYILKPYSIQDIIAAVQKAKKKVEEESTKLNYVYEMEQKVRKSLPMLTQEFFQLLINHEVLEEEVLMRWENLYVNMELKHVALMIIQMNDVIKKSNTMPISEVELFKLSMHNLLQETINNHTNGVLYNEGLDKIVIVFNARTPDEANRIAKTCYQSVSQFTKETISVGLSEVMDSIKFLPTAYQQAVKALSYHFYTHGQGILQHEELQSDSSIFSITSFEQEQELLLAFRSGNEQKLFIVLDESFEHIYDSELKHLPEPRYLISKMYELASTMIRLIVEIRPYANIQSIEEKIEHHRNEKKTNLADFHLLLRWICEEGCACINQEREPEANRIISQAIDYIHANLHKDLTLEHCATQVHLSGSYFANLFKRVTGQTLNHYITQERIKYAKEMIIEGKKVQYIAKALGYRERRYFSSVFKKQTGLTPSEFKEKYLGNGRSV